MKSTDDTRVQNNVMRHSYKVLSDQEKSDMQHIKDAGLAIHLFLDGLALNADGSTRELAIAKTKVEEAVMWAVKHITG